MGLLWCPRSTGLLWCPRNMGLLWCPHSMGLLWCPPRLSPRPRVDLALVQSMQMLSCRPRKREAFMVVLRRAARPQGAASPSSWSLVEGLLGCLRPLPQPHTLLRRHTRSLRTSIRRAPPVDAHRRPWPYPAEGQRACLP